MNEVKSRECNGCKYATKVKLRCVYKSMRGALPTELGSYNSIKAWMRGHRERVCKWWTKRGK
jgi:hypothetical protein